MTGEQSVQKSGVARGDADTAQLHGATHTGKARSNNEDAFLVLPECGVGVVADGMGGFERGDVASQTVIECVQEAVENKLGTADGFRIAHQRIRSMTDPKAEERMGSTAVAVALLDGRATIYWVGDSRAYLCRDGQLRLLTRDHSFVQELLDAGVINQEEADSHPNRSVVTRAIGVRDIEQLEVAELVLDLHPGDRLLLCSDGLSGYLDEQAIGEELSRDGTGPDIAASLIERTLAESTAGDNLTAVVALVLDGPA